MAGKQMLGELAGMVKKAGVLTTLGYATDIGFAAIFRVYVILSGYTA